MKWRPLDLVVPRIPLRLVPRMILVSVVGAVFAGLYGVVHDQITYTISPEYFTRLKFDQFDYARPGGAPDRVFAGVIGFLATWWVGLFLGWAISRVSIAKEGRLPPTGEIAVSFVLTFGVSLLTSLGGWCWGQWRKRTGYGSGWEDWMGQLGVENHDAFMTVGYIHNASYLGGVLGAVVAFLYLNARRRERCDWERSPTSRTVSLSA